MTPSRWPIRRQLMAMTLAVSAVVLLLTAASYGGFEVYSARRTALRRMTTRAQILAANCTAALAFANRGDAEEILSALKTDPRTQVAVLYDRAGRVFATYPATVPAEVAPEAPGRDGSRFERGLVIGVAPVAEEGSRRLGTLYIATDLQEVWGTLRLSGLIGVAVLAVTLVLAYLMSRILQGRISVPILALADTARAISERQDYAVRAAPGTTAELAALTGAFNQMLERIAEQEVALRRYSTELEGLVRDRTLALEERNAELHEREARLVAANAELDAFAYSVSHDLRAPLRSIDGFSQILLEDYGGVVDDAGKDALRRVRAATQRMGMLIDDLLRLSRVTRAELRIETVDLSELARDVGGDLRRGAPDRVVDLRIADGVVVQGDARLLRVVLENLIGNSWKYTGKVADPRIEFGAGNVDGERVFYVRDNGAGFDMRYVDKLFGVFQRLHAATEFEGTGVGLATVRRIITRHNGRIWADGKVGGGATLSFTLPA